jgi:hypothetical protein
MGLKSDDQDCQTAEEIHSGMIVKIIPEYFKENLAKVLKL